MLFRSQDLSQVSRLVKQAIGDNEVIGCSSAGELIRDHALSGGLVIWALGGDGFNVTTGFGTGTPEEGLRNAAAEISLFYRKEGYVAAVSVPKQEVKGGVVLLKVAESRFGGVSIDAASDGRIDPELIRQVILGAMPPGAPTDMRSLDRGLLLVGDLPGASVTGGLAPGTEEGRSDLVVLSRRTPVWSVSLSADNAGSRSTGSARGLATLAFASPWGHGEAISADLLESEGARYGRVGFALPLGAGGDRLSFGASRMDYDLISPEFAAARDRKSTRLNSSHSSVSRMPSSA